MARCKKQPRFSCYNCDYKSSRKHDLASHIRSRHLPRNPSSNNCPKCGKNYSSSSSLRQHIKICHQESDDFKNLQCDLCAYKTYKKRCLVDHIQARHQPRDPYSNRCGRCEKVVSSRSNLQIHLKVCGRQKKLRNPGKSRRFLCELCGAGYVKRSNLEDHKQARHSAESFKCEACGKSFGNRSLVNEHRRYGCEKSGRLTVFECQECDYRTPRRDRLASHREAKHTLESFECEGCGKKYDCRRNLYQHAKYSCKYGMSGV